MTVTDSRLALVVATSEYEDEGLAGLASPAADAAGLARVLAEPATCGFAVSTVLNGRSDEIARTVEDFLAERDRGDLLMLYFSGHGLKDEYGRLYFATRNTVRDRLRSTAVPASLVNDLLLGCRSRRKVLVLDCCYGGAFARGLQVKADPSVHTADQFDARGLVVLTASDATQYAFEGDVVRGEAAPSAFTAHLIEGLETGTADVDGDGLISVDDAYEYVRRQLAGEPRLQSPRKWEFDVQGHIVIGRSGLAGKPAASASPAALPVAISAPAAPAAQTTLTVRQRQWWAGVLLFLATSVLLTAIPVAWAADAFLYGSLPGEYLPFRTGPLLVSLIGAVAWVIAYAVTDAFQHLTDPRPSRWYDLHVAWLHNFATVRRPSSPRTFVRSLLACLPLNVFVTVALTVGATAYSYAQVGSSGRDRMFQLLSVVLTALPLVLYAWLAPPRRPTSGQ